MKSFLILICCLALPIVAQAKDNKKGKHAQNDAQATQVQKQAVIKPGKHAGRSARLQTTTGLQTNPTLTKKQQRRVLGTENNNLPGVQSKTHVGASARMQGGKHKFQVRKFNISTSPNSRIATVKFKAGNRIQGSGNWQGKNYMAFKTYQAQKHDKHWWNNHCSRIVIIGGGWYGWNNGFWIPLWGYDDAYSYYPYDGPIASPGGLDPGQMVANVQAALQEQGYYKGEVDGLIGPLTRAALAQYQSDHGLYTTAAIDEPTLASLGLV